MNMTYTQTLFEGRNDVLFWVKWLVEHHQSMNYVDAPSTDGTTPIESFMVACTHCCCVYPESFRLVLFNENNEEIDYETAKLNEHTSRFKFQYLKPFCIEDTV